MWDLLITGANLCDPANGIEARSDLAIEAGKIVKVAPDLDQSQAKKVIALPGKVIVPGLIDVHVHLSTHTELGFEMVAKAGIVTVIDFAGDGKTLKAALANGEGRGLNLGFLKPAVPQSTISSVDPPEEELETFVEETQREGALGIKMLGGHHPISPATVKALIKIAARDKVFIASHVGTTNYGSNIEGLKETIELAAGNPLYIAHLQSYCRGQTGKDPSLEAIKALELIKSHSNLIAESYLSPFNGTSGRCEEGIPKSHVTRTCLKFGGFPETEEGIRQAIRAGYAHVNMPSGGELIKATGEKAQIYWERQKTNTRLSFPVNSAAAAVKIATAKNNGEFIAKVLSTDGGTIPRNTLVEDGLALVRLGALKLAEFVMKAALNPAKIFGFKTKGHLGVGADADLTVLDLARGKAYLSMSQGELIMLDGVVVGRGGKFLEG